MHSQRQHIKRTNGLHNHQHQNQLKKKARIQSLRSKVSEIDETLGKVSNILTDLHRISQINIDPISINAINCSGHIHANSNSNSNSHQQYFNSLLTRTTGEVLNEIERSPSSCRPLSPFSIPKSNSRYNFDSDIKSEQLQDHQQQQQQQYHDQDHDNEQNAQTQHLITPSCSSSSCNSNDVHNESDPSNNPIDGSTHSHSLRPITSITKKEKENGKFQSQFQWSNCQNALLKYLETKGILLEKSSVFEEVPISTVRSLRIENNNNNNNNININVFSEDHRHNNENDNENDSSRNYSVISRPVTGGDSMLIEDTAVADDRTALRQVHVEVGQLEQQGLEENDNNNDDDVVDNEGSDYFLDVEFFLSCEYYNGYCLFCQLLYHILIDSV